MRIKRSDLNRLIENYLHEIGTGQPKGKGRDSNYTPDKMADDDFKLTPEMEEDYEEYVTAVDAYRHPEKPVGRMPKLFKDQEPHIPSDKELQHVRNYQMHKEIDPQGIEFGVDDDEKTIPKFEEDEDTEESPLGTQYSMDNTHPQFKFNDKTQTDPGHTIHSSDDYVLTPEDEEDYEASEEYTENDTEYGIEEEESILAKIRNFLSGK